MAVDTTRPAFVGLTNYVPDATITADEEAAGHDANELKVASYQTTYRTTGVTASRTVTFDLTATKSDLEAFVLWASNLTDAATWQWQTSNVSDFSVIIDDSGTIAVFDTSLTPLVADTPPWGRPAIYLPSTTYTGRFVRVNLTDTGNADGFLEAAHATIGPADQPAPFGYQAWTPRLELLGPVGRSVAIVGHSMMFRAVTDAARRQIISVARSLHATGRFGLIPRPADDSTWLQEAVLCKITEPPEEALMNTSSGDRWDIRLNVLEVTD